MSDFSEKSQKNSAYQPFAFKLRELREMAGITQQKLADEAFYSLPYITKMEQGLRLPSRDTLDSIIKVLRKGGLEETSLKELEQICQNGKNQSRRSKVDSGVGSALANSAKPHYPGDTALQLELKNDPSIASWGSPKNYSQFFGRDKALVEILQVLQQSELGKTIIIAGLGGIGKTAFAHEIALKAIELKIFDHFIYESAQTVLLNNGKIEQVSNPSAWSIFTPELSFKGLLDGMACHFSRRDLLDDNIPISLKLRELNTEFQKNRVLLIIDNLENCNDPRLVFTYLTRILKQSNSLLVIISRIIFDYLEGYPVKLDPLDPAVAKDFLIHQAKIQNVNALNIESKFQEQALDKIIEATGGHPLAMQLVVYQLKFFSLPFILENLQINYSQKALLNYRLAEGLYTYIYKEVWNRLGTVPKKLLTEISQHHKEIDENELLNLFEAVSVLLPGQAFDLWVAVKELVQAGMLDVVGDLHKNYKLQPLTIKFLNTELSKQWI